MHCYKWIACALTILSGTAWASGNTLPRPNAAALGMADANVAISQGPSSQFINPANLAAPPDTKGSWEAGALVGRVEANFRRPSAAEATLAGDYRADAIYPVIPYVASLHPWSEAVTVGFSLESPHGLSTEWPDHTFDLNLGPFGTADLAQKSELRVIRLGPAAAMKLNDRWAIGGRLFVQHVEASEQNDISKVKGDGNTLGAQIGIRYTRDNMILGAAYTTRTRTEIEGSLSNIHPVAAGSLVAGDASADILLPARLQTGIALRVSRAVWWELDLDWIEWSYVDELTIMQSNGTIANAGRNQRHNRNTLSIRSGVKWEQSPQLTLYAGLGYDPSPVPEEDASPTSSVVRKTRVGIGATHQLSIGKDLSVAYQFIRGHSRQINESSQDSFGVTDTNLYEGTYDSRSHVIGISYRSEF